MSTVLSRLQSAPPEDKHLRRPPTPISSPGSIKTRAVPDCSHVPRRITVKQFLGEAASRGTRKSHISRKVCSAINEDAFLDVKSATLGLDQKPGKEVVARRTPLGEKDTNIPPHENTGRYLSFRSCLRASENRSKLEDVAVGGKEAFISTGTSKDRKSILRFRVAHDSDELSTGGYSLLPQRSQYRIIGVRDPAATVTPEAAPTDILKGALRRHRPPPIPPRTPNSAPVPGSSLQRSATVSAKPKAVSESINAGPESPQGIIIQRSTVYRNNTSVPKQSSPLTSSLIADGDILLHTYGTPRFDRASWGSPVAASPSPVSPSRRRRTSARGTWKTYHHGLSRSCLSSIRGLWEERYLHWVEAKRRAFHQKSRAVCNVDQYPSKSNNNNKGLPRVDKPLNPDIFPRLGNLSALHPDAPNSPTPCTRYLLSIFADSEGGEGPDDGSANASRGTRIDYYLGTRSLSFIKRTLYLFDLDRRMIEIAKQTNTQGVHCIRQHLQGVHELTLNTTVSGTDDIAWDTNWELRWEVLAALLHRNRTTIGVGAICGDGDDAADEDMGMVEYHCSDFNQIEWYEGNE